MNKTILKLDKDISIIILSIISIFFTFISSYNPVAGIISFLLVLIKTIIFVLVPLSLYVFEKKELQFKRIAGFYFSYFSINLIITIIASISFVDGTIPYVWRFLFDLINLIILISSLLIFFEQILEYSGVRSIIYKKTVMKIVYMIGDFVSYPFLLLVNKNVCFNEKEDD